MSTPDRTIALPLSAAERAQATAALRLMCDDAECWSAVFSGPMWPALRRAQDRLADQHTPDLALTALEARQLDAALELVLADRNQWPTDAFDAADWQTLHSAARTVASALAAATLPGEAGAR